MGTRAHRCISGPQSSDSKRSDTMMGWEQEINSEWSGTLYITAAQDHTCFLLNHWNSSDIHLRRWQNFWIKRKILPGEGGAETWEGESEEPTQEQASVLEKGRRILFRLKNIKLIWSMCKNQSSAMATTLTHWPERDWRLQLVSQLKQSRFSSNDDGGDCL